MIPPSSDGNNVFQEYIVRIVTLLAGEHLHRCRLVAGMAGAVAVAQLSLVIAPEGEDMAAAGGLFQGDGERLPRRDRDNIHQIGITALFACHHLHGYELGFIRCAVAQFTMTVTTPGPNVPIWFFHGQRMRAAASGADVDDVLQKAVRIIGVLGAGMDLHRRS